MKKSVSIIIPAYNEEGNISDAVDSCVQAVKGLVDSYELLVVNDGSTDQTAAVVQGLCKDNSNIFLLNNNPNLGYGVAFAKGVRAANKEFVTVFPGDNDMSGDSLRKLIKIMGRKDVITTHVEEAGGRSWFRKFLSKAFVVFMNGLFGMRLKYFNGSFICRTEILKSIPIKSEGLAALAECMVRLIKLGYPYESVGFEHVGRKADKSKAINLRSVVAVFKTILVLVKDIYFSKDYRAQYKKLCSI